MRDFVRTGVLSVLAVGLAGLVWAAEPINAVLQGQHDAVISRDGVQIALNGTPSATPPAADKIVPAPLFTPAADPLKLQPYDRVLGKENAPVTVIEYASLTCSHCHDFSVKTFPKMQDEWITPGKVRYVLRDLPWDNMALGMAVTARCAPAQSYYPLVQALFASQETIFNAGDKVGAIAQVARLGGLDRAQVEACIRNEDYQKLSNGMKVDGQTKLGIKGTPTFFVNGTEVDGFQEYADFKPYLEKAYAAAMGKKK